MGPLTSGESAVDPVNVGTSVPPPGHAGQPLVQQQQQPPPPPPLSPPRERRRSGLIAIGAAGILAVLAGLAFLLFGSGGTQLGGPVAQAATLSSSTPGYRMHMSIEMTSSALGSPITATASGIVDLRDHATSMSMVMNLGNEPQVVQQLGSSSMRMDMVMAGGAVYIKLPPALTARLQTSGRQWIKVDLGKLSALPGLSSLGSDPTATDPSQTLQLLRSVSGSVVNLGPAKVDGVQTTHYRAELSLSDVAKTIPSAERGAVQQALSTLEQALPGGEFPMDVWVDGNHFVRRATTSLDLTIPSGQSMQETVTVDFGDYGPQAPPAKPPPDQVLDISGLAGAGG